MLKKVSFNFKGREITIDAKECRGICKIFGLVFKRRQNASALLFSFNKPSKIRIHSLFVFFPFVAVWLDEEDNAIDVKEIKPFTMSAEAKRPYRKLLEIPLNEKYKKKIRLLQLCYA